MINVNQSFIYYVEQELLKNILQTLTLLFQYSVKNGKPSDEELETISRNIGVDWKPLGRRLKFKEPELDAFDENHKEFTEKPYQMLLHWKRREGEKATYLVLHDALCHDLVTRKDLANEICCQWET